MSTFRLRTIQVLMRDTLRQMRYAYTFGISDFTTQPPMQEWSEQLEDLIMETSRWILRHEEAEIVPSGEPGAVNEEG